MEPIRNFLVEDPGATLVSQADIAWREKWDPRISHFSRWQMKVF